MDNMPGMDMPAPHQNVKAEGPAIGFHGMLIVGEETIYVSHLPMWMTFGIVSFAKGWERE